MQEQNAVRIIVIYDLEVTAHCSATAAKYIFEFFVTSPCTKMPGGASDSVLHLC